jgi:hypothetical protein
MLYDDCDGFSTSAWSDSCESRCRTPSPSQTFLAQYRSPGESRLCASLALWSAADAPYLCNI